MTTAIEAGTMAKTWHLSKMLPIDEVARRLGLRASAIRYYEECGLVEPVSRHAGRRWYGPVEIRRLAIIRYWQSAGLMSLDEIRHVLSGPSRNQRVDARWSRSGSRSCACRSNACESGP